MKGILFLVVLIAGCAIKPADVKPLYVSEDRYIGSSCGELAGEQTRTAAELASAVNAQWAVIERDTFIGVPVSAAQGTTQAPNIARLKGEIEAIQRAGAAKTCDLPKPPALPGPPPKKPQPVRKPGPGTT